MKDDALAREIRRIAWSAGELIMGHYGGPVVARTKADSSPVTAADEAANEHIVTALAALTPGVPIVAEESAPTQGLPAARKDTFWLVDPLDGTKEFLSKNGEFTVNI